MVEFGSHLVTKQPARSSGTYCPCIDIFGIAPYQVTECTLMRNLLSSGDNPDLINGPDFGTEPAMYAENGSVHDRSEDQEVKDLTACLPHRCVSVFCLTFLVEAVDLCDLSGFVVASDEDDSIRVSTELVSNSTATGIR